MKATTFDAERADKLRESFTEAQKAIKEIGFVSRETALALTKLDEARLWFEDALKGKAYYDKGEGR